jgi:transcriptional regulator with XRE-family HTH domain
MLSLKTPAEVALELAGRVRERRLQRGWTQPEIAVRAGLKTPTYVLFERSGRIALLRLLKILEILDLLDEFDRIGRGQDLAGLSLDELTRPARRRGRRQAPPESSDTPATGSASRP